MYSLPLQKLRTGPIASTVTGKTSSTSGGGGAGSIKIVRPPGTATAQQSLTLSRSSAGGAPTAAVGSGSLRIGGLFGAANTGRGGSVAQPQQGGGTSSMGSLKISTVGGVLSLVRPNNAAATASSGVAQQQPMLKLPISTSMLYNRNVHK